MTELSAIAKIINALELAKANELGCDLTYFDVLELLGYIKDMKATVVDLSLEFARSFHRENEVRNE